MSILTIKCPDCGARVRASFSKPSTACDYCGNHVLLPEGAWGMRKEHGLPLPHQVDALSLSLDRTRLLEQRLEEARRELVDLEEKQRRRRSWKGRASSLIIPLCVFLIIFMIFQSTNPKESVSPATVMAIIAYLPILVVRKVASMMTERGIKRAKERCASLENGIKSLKDHQDLDLLPEGYRHVEGISFVLKAIKNGRARSLEEALAQYDARPAGQ